jgi:acylphosphatase
MASEQEQLHAIVYGRVQGVNFRYYTVQEARSLGLTGWVRNRIDGTVEVLAEGPRPQLDRLVAYLHRGPSSAQVARVDMTWGVATGAFPAFDVRYSTAD